MTLKPERPAPEAPASPRKPARSAAPPPTMERLIADYARSRDARARDRIVTYYRPYVHRLASRFSRREPLEDLTQIGTIGLIRALDSYDPGRGCPFLAYATRSVLGEIKHYLRDRSWQMRPSREMQDRLMNAQRAESDLTGRLGRRPTVQEVAQEMGVTEEEVLAAMEMGRLTQPVSLDAPVDGQTEEGACLRDQVGRIDPALRDLVDYLPLWNALEHLGPREREIVRLRFFEDVSQEKVAEHLAVSQMHVSRLQRRALDRLKGMLESAP